MFAVKFPQMNSSDQHQGTEKPEQLSPQLKNENNGESASTDETLQKMQLILELMLKEV